MRNLPWRVVLISVFCICLAALLYFWRVHDWRLKATLKGHLGGIQYLAFSEDGALLASAGKDGTAKVWDVPSGRLLLSLVHPSERIDSLSFSPSGKLLATGTSDGLVTVWDIDTGKAVKRLHHTNTEGSSAIVAFNPATAILAVGLGGTIYLWDVASWELDAILDGERHLPFWELSISPDGRFLAASAIDKTVIIWEIANRTKLVTFQDTPPGGKNNKLSIAFASDGKQVLTAGWNRMIIRYSVDKHVGDTVSAVFPYPVLDIACSSDGSIVALVLLNGSVWLLDSQTYEQTEEVKARATCIAFHPRAAVLATGDSSGNVTIWDISRTMWVPRK